MRRSAEIVSQVFSMITHSNMSEVLCEAKWSLQQMLSVIDNLRWQEQNECVATKSGVVTSYAVSGPCLNGSVCWPLLPKEPTTVNSENWERIQGHCSPNLGSQTL